MTSRKDIEFALARTARRHDWEMIRRSWSYYNLVFHRANATVKVRMTGARIVEAWIKRGEETTGITLPSRAEVEAELRRP